jgi:F-type H+-transporting ATPase subunit b
MRRFVYLTTALSLVVSAAARAEEEATMSPFAGDVGVALWTLVIFLIVVGVLGKFAWRPILTGLQNREKFIRDSLEQARAEREKAEARLKEYTDKLDAARGEATAIVEEARRDADAVRRRIEEEANAEAAKIVERAKREIGLARESAIKELYSVTAHLSTEVASKILAREITASDHERLIRDSIARLGGGAS